MRRALAVGVLLAMAPPPAALAQAFDAVQVDAGMGVYKPAMANCEPCHGYGGVGALALDEYGGKGTAFAPSLVTSRMTREEMIEVVACGIRNDWLTMPQYLQKAWTPERPCYGGKTLATVAESERPFLAKQPLTEAQIAAVVAFVQAFYQGSPMNLEKCARYWGDRSPACGIFR
ncbi:MAG: cytochrome c [Alphaproteobacteria bacterium]|nr:cytochrome c [Alphaproteobacteria bacterium]